MNKTQELRKLEKKFRRLEDEYDRVKGAKKDKVLRQAEKVQERIDHLKG